jgi:putative tricarboxylic transport membrane protein
MVGTDVSTGQQRFTFGYPELIGDGLSGRAGDGPVRHGRGHRLASTGRIGSRRGADSDHGCATCCPTRTRCRSVRCRCCAARASARFFGALPGTGPTIASFMSYSVEKKVSRDPERFGKGAIEGVVAPESANNAAAQTAFIPR